jgi:hypothetical protein
MSVVGWIVDRIFSLFGRVRPPELRDPERFTSHGLSFDYPRNWKIDKEDASEGCFSVHLETAMGSVCCVTVMVPNVGMELAEYAEAAVGGFHDGLGEAFRLGPIRPLGCDGWIVDPVTHRVAGKDRKGVRLDVKARGLGESIESRFEIWHVDEPDHCVFVLTNSTEVDRWDVEQPGYEVVLHSLAVAASVARGAN